MSESQSPGRPRSEDADKAILVAALELLQEVGYLGLSMEGVAARAKVAKTTLYRHYSSKLELVTAAASRERRAGVPIPDTGDTAKDLELWLRTAAAFWSQTAWGKVVAGIAAEPEGQWTAEIENGRREFWRGRISDVAKIFQRGIERGDLREDLDPEFAVEIALGPILFRTLVSGEQLSPEFAEKLVEEMKGYAER